MSVLHVLQVPVLSPKHLRPDTYVTLKSMRDVGDDWSNPPTYLVAAHLDSGNVEVLFVYVEEDVSDIANVGQDLIDIFTWARSHGYEWIRFDRVVGSIVDVLPTYEWP